MARVQLLWRSPAMFLWPLLGLMFALIHVTMRGPNEPLNVSALATGLAMPVAAIGVFSAAVALAGIGSRTVDEICTHGIRYVFSPENVVAESKHATTTFAWSLVRRGWETRTVFALSVNQQLVIVPKRCFAPGDADRLRALLVDRGVLRRPR